MITPEDEIERTEALRLARESFGDRVAERFGPGTVGQHELWDRLHVFRCMWEHHIESHPSMALDAEAFAISQRVGELIGEIYQRMGREPEWEATL